MTNSNEQHAVSLDDIISLCESEKNAVILIRKSDGGVLYFSDAARNLLGPASVHIEDPLKFASFFSNDTQEDIRGFFTNKSSSPVIVYTEITRDGASHPVLILAHDDLLGDPQTPFRIIRLFRTPAGKNIPWKDMRYFRTIIEHVPISIWEYDLSEALHFKNEVRSVVNSSQIKDFELFFDNNPGLYKEILSSLVVIDVNYESVKLYGASSKAELKASFGKNVTPESYWAMRRVMAAYLAGEKSIECETVNKTLDGRLLNVILRVTFPADERLSKVALATVTDISERRRIEKALQESEKRYREIFNIVPVAIFEYDYSRIAKLLSRMKRLPIERRMSILNNHKTLFKLINRIRLTDINDETVAMYHANDKNDFIMHFGFKHTPESIETYKNSIATYLSGQTIYTSETINLTLDNQRINILYKIVFPEKESLSYRAIVIAVDITNRKKIEETLKRQTMAMELSVDGMAIFDADVHYIYVNESYAHIFGYNTTEEIKHKSWRVLYTEENIEFFEKRIIPRFSRTGFWAGETTGRKKDNTLIPLEVTLTAIDGGGFISVIRDISARKESERALKESEAHFRYIVKQAPFPIAVISSNGNYEYINEKFSEIFGYTLDDISDGREWFRRAFPNEEQRKHVIKTWKQDAENNFKINRQYKIRCKNGLDRDVIFRVVVLPNGTMYITYEDITEQKRLEEERLKVSKLDSLGILAGGIAHDFNNILTAVLGNISLAKSMCDDVSIVSQKLQKAEQACFRAQDLTRQLLTFSRGGAPIREAASIGELIEESASFSLIGSNVRCDFIIPDNILPVNIDKGQTSQVINNLIINADQAMPNGGVITVELRNISSKDAPDLDLKSSEYVRIAITDQGIGIPEEHLSKIFDPYFTTKEKGRGLGLATAYAIISRHDGIIKVDSIPGKGTTFYIYLPACKQPQSQNNHCALSESQVTVKPARILVMDDEKEIRNLLREMLTFMGHAVTLTIDGEDAVEAYQKAMFENDPFSLVIMDLTVPGGMGGKEAIKKLIEIDPHVNAIVSSGYSNDPVIADYKKYGFKDFISKPYRFDQMKDVVERVLISLQ